MICTKLAYEKIHNTEFAILLYPQDTAEKFTWKHTINSDNSEPETYIISTCVDLSEDFCTSQNQLKDRLKEIFNYVEKAMKSIL